MTGSIRSRADCLVGALLSVSFACLSLSCAEQITPGVLVFSKTDGYRHESIPRGIEAIREIGARNGYVIDATENAALIREENLANYQAVVFLNTTLNVLTKQQQNDFERFIQAGGGFVGVHAAADTEYDWPWYNGLVGAYFDSHPNSPNVRTAEFYTVASDHASMDSIPDRFEVTDEFYNFKSIKRELITVLIEIDESTYEGGTNGGNHPMSWYHEYDGGRSFYTAMGHTNEMYANPLFLKHLDGGIRYAVGGDRPRRVNYARARTLRVPDENRFSKVVLAEGLDEPVELAVMSDNRVLFVERKGGIKLYEPDSGKVRLIHTLPVSRKYKYLDSGRDEGEDGLLGVALDPNFDENGWLYMYYSLAGDRPVNVLTRWDFRDGDLVEESVKTLLEVEVQRDQCCHTGGSIAFDAQGDLYLSTGDNTSPRGTAYAPIDERPGRSPWDAQKGSANTNDLRGKILRIRPKDDGTYAIPEGNLFPAGTAGTRPEIYGMGMRNPYRISVDQKTGYVYWGDVGPDARSDSAAVGPVGYDEINQMREPGFFGWPYFIADNRAYHDFDFESGIGREAFDPQNPINESPNNTGLTNLPPAQPAFIAYTYGLSDEWPILGTGGRTAMAGPVYHRDLFPNSEYSFPNYYDGKLFIYEWIRGWVLAATMDEEGDLVEIEPFMPSYKFSNPMDMEFGPNGDLYMLEYGSGWFQQNPDARLVRIQYNGGNRKPVVEVAADKPRGAVPLTVSLSSDGTNDPDDDELSYEWVIRSPDDQVVGRFSEPNPKFTFDNVGSYSVTLTVSDENRESSVQELSIVAGNEPPVVRLEIVGVNSSFFFPDRPFRYRATAKDLEDGDIPDAQIRVAVDFLTSGVTSGDAGTSTSAGAVGQPAGRALMERSDCMACHQVDQPSVGPMYIDVARRYEGDPGAGDRLIRRILEGGSGTWGHVAMPPHPTISVDDARKMVSYILGLAGDSGKKELPAAGQYVVRSADMKSSAGVLVLRASYEDQGANGMPSVHSEQVLTLASPTVSANAAIDRNGVDRMVFGDSPLLIGNSDGAWVQFPAIDFTGLKSLVLAVSALQQFGYRGGYVELRIGSSDGEVVGTSQFIEPTTSFGARSFRVNLKRTSGKHPLFVTYRNDEGGPGPLFVLTGFTVEGS